MQNMQDQFRRAITWPMERIELEDFTQLEDSQIEALVSEIQTRRQRFLSEAVTSKKRTGTKSAARNKGRKSANKTPKNEKDLAKLLNSMSPEQLAKFKAKMGL